MERLIACIGTYSMATPRCAKVAHGLKMLSSLEQMKTDEVECDFKIMVQTREFPVHRAVLMASSDYFKAMLSHDLREAREGEVELQEVDADAMSECIRFIYSGECFLNDRNVRLIIHASDILQLTQLTTVCFAFMLSKLSPESCFLVRQLALRYNHMAAFKKVNRYMVTNVNLVIDTQGFAKMKSSDVTAYLLAFEREPDLQWTITRTWLQKGPDERAHAFLNIVHGMNLQQLSFRSLLGLWKNAYVKPSDSTKNLVATALLASPKKVAENITDDNIFLLKAIATQYPVSPDSRVVIENFIKSSFAVLSERSEMLDLQMEEVLELLEADATRLCPEIKKWNFLVKWVKSEEPSRKIYFPGLFQAIDLRRLPVSFIRESVLTEQLVGESHLYKDKVIQALCTLASRKRGRTSERVGHVDRPR